ncbi:hypothetical protein ACFOHS_17720 [Jhaorihella thermophila]
MKLLFAGLDGAAAAHVVAALEQKGVEFEVRGNSVYVPAGVRDELRMTLAGEGLPANGEKGIRAAGFPQRIWHHVADVRCRVLARAGRRTGANHYGGAEHCQSPRSYCP